MLYIETVDGSRLYLILPLRIADQFRKHNRFSQTGINAELVKNKFPRCTVLIDKLCRRCPVIANNPN